MIGVIMMAMTLRSREDDFNLCGSDPVAPDLAFREPIARDRDFFQTASELWQTDACIDKCAQAHVAADSRRTIEISYFHLFILHVSSLK